MLSKASVRSVSLNLVVVGKDYRMLKTDTNGYAPLRLFARGKGMYKIAYNEDNKAYLHKIMDNSIETIPLFNEEYVNHLRAGKTILIDEDIVRLPNVIGGS